MAVGRSGSVRELLFQVGDDVGGRRARPEEPAAALLGKLLHVLFRDDATPKDEDVTRAFLFEQSQRLGEERHMRAGQHRQADDINIFLQRRLGRSNSLRLCAERT